MRVLLVVACALVALAAAPAAHAKVTIGSSLAETPIFALSNNVTASATAIPGRQVAAPSSGVITLWRVRAGASVTPVRLVVVRRPEGVGDKPGAVVARSAPINPTENEETESNTRLPISEDEYIGLECCAGGVGHFLGGADGGAVDVWSPALDVGVPSMPVPPIAPNLELLVNADIEPDQDGDGFGDESQDSDDRRRTATMTETASTTARTTARSQGTRIRQTPTRTERATPATRTAMGTAS